MEKQYTLNTHNLVVAGDIDLRDKTTVEIDITEKLQLPTLIEADTLKLTPSSFDIKGSIQEIFNESVLNLAHILLAASDPNYNSIASDTNKKINKLIKNIII